MKCPVCGGNMDMNLRKDENYVQDEHWYEMSQRYDEFLNKIQNKNMVLLEIGVFSISEKDKLLKFKQ